MPGIQMILHPTDFSENCRPAFQTACALARDYHATLLVLHVMFPSASPLLQGPLPDPLRSVESREDLAQLPWPRPSDPQIRVEHRLAEGDPAEEILRLSEAVLRTSAVEVVRLIVRAGQEIPQHKSEGEIIVHCLEGRVAFTAFGKTQVLAPGKLLHLPAGEPHAFERNRGCFPSVDDPPPERLTGRHPIRDITGSSIMLEKIISGGQSGADQAGWCAARTFGVSSGGWMTRGFLTEDGPHPEFADEYGAAELSTESDTARTQRNVQDSDATLWFGVTTTSVAQATVGACHRFAKPCMPVYPGASFEPCQVATWIAENKFRTLNVAGNREQEEPGIGDRVERFLGEVLQQLGHERPDPGATFTAHGKILCPTAVLSRSMLRRWRMSVSRYWRTTSL